MMRHVAIVAFGLAVLGIPSCAGESPPLQGDPQKLGYSIGYQLGSDFRRQGIELEPERLVQGVVDALQQNEPALTAREMRQTLIEVRRKADLAE
jgi:FKBP-type peptidyl-prolyl cis-trans isomerase FklB